MLRTVASREDGNKTLEWSLEERLRSPGHEHLVSERAGVGGLDGIDYRKLTLAEIRAGLEDVAQQAQTTFGRLDVRQLNWRPDETRWSIAQCFDHLLTADRLILRAAQDALRQAQARTLWQRLPIWPRVLGRLLIRSQTPAATRKYTASPLATPTSSDIHSDIVQRFISAHDEVGALIQPLDERVADRTIMTSPFIGIITYSVLHGYRLMLAHDRRHCEQARRVMLSRGFPGTPADA